MVYNKIFGQLMPNVQLGGTSMKKMIKLIPLLFALTLSGCDLAHTVLPNGNNTNQTGENGNNNGNNTNNGENGNTDNNGGTNNNSGDNNNTNNGGENNSGDNNNNGSDNNNSGSNEGNNNSGNSGDNTGSNEGSNNNQGNNENNNSGTNEGSNNEGNNTNEGSNSENNNESNNNSSSENTNENTGNETNNEQNSGSQNENNEQTNTNTPQVTSESVTFSEQGYSNGQEIGSYNGTNFSITFDAGENSNAPKYYSTGSSIRAYGSNTFTFESSTANMTKIVFTFGEGDQTNTISASYGAYSSGAWTGSTKQVTFTVGGTSGHRRLAGFEVTFDSAVSSGSNSSGNEQQGGGNETPTPNETAAWTIMLYVCGSDLESGNDGNGNYDPANYGGQATADIKEILSVNNQPDDINIIIETGGAGAWSSTLKDSSNAKIATNKLGRYHVANKKIVRDAQLTNASMGAKETFQSFLEWGLTNYPAEKTGVILWNHGGAMSGVCSDENYAGDTLTNSEVKAALQGAFTSKSVTEKLDFIGYDACLMQVQDIADFNSAYFNYMIASEESEAGTGWDYDTWVDDLYAKKSTTNILKAICDGFIADQDPNYENDQTLSYLDLSKVAAYREAFEALAASMTSIVKTKAFSTFMKNVKNYGGSWLDDDYYQSYLQNGYEEYMFDPNTEVEDNITYHWLYGYYDFGSFDAKDFLNKLNSNTSLGVNKTNVSNALTALNQVILYSAKGDEAGNSYGLAFICPMDEWGSENFYNVASETNFVTWRNAITDSNRVYDND